MAVLGALSLMFVSCEQQEEPIPVLSFKSTMITAKGGTQPVTVAAQGTWALSLDPESASDWLSFSQYEGTGVVAVTLTVTPNEADDIRTAAVVLTTPNHKITTVLTQGSGTMPAQPLWMELPLLDQEKLGFFTHSMDGGKYINREQSGVRNWSFYYDYDAYVSWWVAYPLNSGLIGKGSRTNSWQATDPLLPASAVCNLSNGSYGGGWTRGHQIPSADRLNNAANISTFYPTNMTPQDYDFNGGDNFSGIWVRLENQVRTYATKSTCDTLYVVTGADVRNSNSWSGKNGGHAAKVPTHYYKALLKKTKGTNPTYSAVGFYIPHSKSVAGDDFMDYACSIDELEEKSGVDFFASLAVFLGKDKAQEIEAADPATTLKNW